MSTSFYDLVMGIGCDDRISGGVVVGLGGVESGLAGKQGRWFWEDLIMEFGERKSNFVNQTCTKRT